MISRRICGTAFRNTAVIIHYRTNTDVLFSYGSRIADLWHEKLPVLANMSVVLKLLLKFSLYGFCLRLNPDQKGALFLLNG